MAPDASLSDGLLDLVVVGNVSRFRFLLEFPRVFAGRHIDGKKVTALKVKGIEVDAGSPLVVYADGDPLTRLPARIRVLPLAIHVIVPGGPPS